MIRFLLLAMAISSQAWATNYLQDGFFVKTSSRNVGFEARLSKMVDVMSVEPSELVSGLLFVKVRPDASYENVFTNVGKMRGVQYVERNYLRHVGHSGVNSWSADGAPKVFPQPVEKPASPTVWKNDPEEFGNYGAHMIGAHFIWPKYTAGDSKVIIADIDTGVDYNHEDLAGNIWHNSGEEGLDANGHDKRTNGIDDDGNGFVDDFIGWDFVRNANLPYDEHGHGTHTSGIAAAVGGNGVGTSGVCPRCSVMPLRFIGPTGEGSDDDGIKAIEYAIKNGAKILNCSWGGTDASQTLADVFKAASDAGVFVATAAGNDGKDIDVNDFYPAIYQYPGKVTVAALYPVNIFIPVWSNYGHMKVQTANGGSDVYSSLPGNQYASWSGTSMATPGIAGAAGLIWSYRPNLKATDIVELMKKYVIPDKDSISKVNFHGRPDMKAIFKNL